MEIQLTPEQEARLDELANFTGKNADELVQDAIRSYLLDYQKWMQDAREKIDEGFAQAERGELIDDEQLWNDLERRKDDFPQRHP